jgi:hypothetical protein
MYIKVGLIGKTQLCLALLLLILKYSNIACSSNPDHALAWEANVRICLLHVERSIAAYFSGIASHHNMIRTLCENINLRIGHSPVVTLTPLLTSQVQNLRKISSWEATNGDIRTRASVTTLQHLLLKTTSVINLKSPHSRLKAAHALSPWDRILYNILYSILLIFYLPH